MRIFDTSPITRCGVETGQNILILMNLVTVISSFVNDWPSLWSTLFSHLSSKFYRYEICRHLAWFDLRGPVFRNEATHVKLEDRVGTSAYDRSLFVPIWYRSLPQLWGHVSTTSLPLKNGRNICSVVNNSAADCVILLKFVTESDHVTPDETNVQGQVSKVKVTAWKRLITKLVLSCRVAESNGDVRMLIGGR